MNNKSISPSSKKKTVEYMSVPELEGLLWEKLGEFEQGNFVDVTRALWKMFQWLADQHPRLSLEMDEIDKFSLLIFYEEDEEDLTSEVREGGSVIDVEVECTEAGESDKIDFLYSWYEFERVQFIKRFSQLDGGGSPDIEDLVEFVAAIVSSQL